MEIREATADDWRRIWPFFAAIVADGETYAYPDDLTSDQARDLWLGEAGAGGVAFVATDDDGRVIGTAKSGPNRPGRGAHVATASFMVDPEATARGVGRALGERVLAWAAEAGFHGMQFNAVVETNTRALALWRSLGFETIGVVPQAFDSRTHGLVGLHVMYRRL